MRRFWLGLSIPFALGLATGCAGGRAPEAPPSMSAIATGSAPPMEPAVSDSAGAYDREEAKTESAAAPMQMGYPQQPPPMPVPVAPAGGAAGTPATAKPTAPAAEARSKEFLVYTATFTLAVYQVEIGLDKAEEIGRSLGGYLASRGDQEIVIRVPRERFREALGQIEKLGDVVHRDVRAIDVTDEYVDTESRLKNAKVMRDRLQTLLAKAAVKEAIEIEKELGRVTEQIEVLEGKMKSLSDRIAFSTITVRYSAKGSGGGRPNFQLPFAWVHSLGVHRLLNFRQTVAQ